MVNEGSVTLPSGHTFDALVVRNVAEFWIQMGERFVHIRYFAVRSPDGGYLGTLEVSQDLTAKRALTGEQRLLSYDDDRDEEAST